MGYHRFKAGYGTKYGSFEVFSLDGSINDDLAQEDGTPYEAGWYWQACFPGCMPDGDPQGPFVSEEFAIMDAQNQEG